MYSFSSLLIYRFGIIIIGLLVIVFDRMLQPCYRRWVPKMLFAVMSEMIFTTKIQFKRPRGTLLESCIMTGNCFLCNFSQDQFRQSANLYR